MTNLFGQTLWEMRSKEGLGTNALAGNSGDPVCACQAVTSSMVHHTGVIHPVYKLGRHSCPPALEDYKITFKK